MCVCVPPCKYPLDMKTYNKPQTNAKQNTVEPTVWPKETIVKTDEAIYSSD